MLSLPKISSVVKRRPAVLSIPKALHFELFLNLEAAKVQSSWIGIEYLCLARFSDPCPSVFGCFAQLLHNGIGTREGFDGPEDLFDGVA